MMVKNLFILATVCLTLNSCGQVTGNPVAGVVIDKNIKAEVEKHISPAKDLDTIKGKIEVYNNSLFAEIYQNDSLIANTYNKAVPKQLFKSFYYRSKDSLKIDGAFGLFTGIGFSINIYKNKATLYHLLSSDETPGYAYKPSGALISRLEVPCTSTKIVLSEIPDSTKKQTIYGYAEFKSDNYYSSEGEINGKEILPRKKTRVNMKIYFKSRKFEL